MRERLIELLNEAREKCANTPSKNCKECSGYGKGYECINALIADYLLANGVIVPPCKVGDWIWYVYRNEINKAKVEEIRYDASKHGGYNYSFSIYAYDFKNKRELSWHPINETQKNKSNINGVEGADFGEDVYVFPTKAEAEAALKGGVQE